MDEIRRQPEALASFARLKLPKLPQGSIFVGAGDSYAAALAGFYMSEGSCLALDPYSLAAYPGMASNRNVVFVSASGKTTSNVAAAKRVRGKARKTWVITADGGSRLASMVDETVKIPMSYVPRAPGMLSFSLSLLAALKMSCGLGGCDFSRAFRRADARPGGPAFGNGTTYFLGNSTAYALSIYAAGKTYELLGAKSHAELLEEFSHLEVFSLRKGDTVNIFTCCDTSRMGERLCRLLATQGFDVRTIPGRGAPPLEGLFSSLFAVQLAAMEEASARGLSEPRFLSASKSLAVSDAMIY